MSYDECCSTDDDLRSEGFLSVQVYALAPEAARQEEPEKNCQAEIGIPA